MRRATGVPLSLCSSANAHPPRIPLGPYAWADRCVFMSEVPLHLDQEDVLEQRLEKTLTSEQDPARSSGVEDLVVLQGGTCGGLFDLLEGCAGHVQELRARERVRHLFQRCPTRHTRDSQGQTSLFWGEGCARYVVGAFWFVFWGLWFVVCGVWFVVCGLWLWSGV